MFVHIILKKKHKVHSSEAAVHSGVVPTLDALTLVTPPSSPVCLCQSPDLVDSMLSSVTDLIQALENYKVRLFCCLCKMGTVVLKSLKTNENATVK